VSFEEGKVRCLLKLLFMPKAEGALVRLVAAETGTPRLTMDAFNRTYPTFPILLGTATLAPVKLHLDPRCLLPAMFKAFHDTPLATAFSDYYEQAAPRAAGRTVGLIVPRKGMRNGFLIHGNGLEGLNYHGLSLSYVGKAGAIYVRPFDAMISTIAARGHGWRPE
jgi:hypothetical protein